MGEVEATPWMPKKEYAVPQIKINGTDAAPAPNEKSVLDYMGVPTKIKKPFSVNALPVRAYVKIWNEFFRDENVDNTATLKTDDADVTYEFGKEDWVQEAENNAYKGGNLLPVNKFHDYFTSCLPYPQRGPAVALPMVGDAPVQMKNADGAIYQDRESIYFNTSTGTEHANYIFNQKMTSLPNPSEYANIIGTNKDGKIGKQGILTTDLSTITATTINDLRKAVAVQQYYEALARGGSRYREQVQTLWNVVISDKTVQVPEYLGGGRYHVNINQIVQTSGQQTSNDTPIGETGAMSVTPINENSFTKSFEEHGFVIGVCCVRHNRSYQQGLERFWSRIDRLDYYVPQFANLGEQPVKKKEIMLTGDKTDEETFGYQEAWADYRMKPNRVSGKMRSNASGTLDFWHYADNYTVMPTLSQDWMEEGKIEIARTLIVQNEPQFFGAIRVANKTTRRMPLYSVPGLYKL